MYNKDFLDWNISCGLLPRSFLFFLIRLYSVVFSGCDDFCRAHLVKLQLKFVNYYYFFLFAVFILYSRESELYRYVLDGKSALAWELLFPRCLGHLSST